MLHLMIGVLGDCVDMGRCLEPIFAFVLFLDLVAVNANFMWSACEANMDILEGGERCLKGLTETKTWPM